jgi:hypothetical protein
LRQYLLINRRNGLPISRRGSRLLSGAKLAQAVTARESAGSQISARPYEFD